MNDVDENASDTTADQLREQAKSLREEADGLARRQDAFVEEVGKPIKRLKRIAGEDFDADVDLPHGG
jgi:uncharacterized coiled-coil DUF342 family protein